MKNVSRRKLPPFTAPRMAGARVLVAASYQSGLYSAISGLVHPGSEVIYFEAYLIATRRLFRLQGAPGRHQTRCRVLP
ncbi:hypothetical protein KIF59_02245 [Enterobacter cloacae subsp. cloacae]|nr:hypothetical protein [Enterobacter cloacae subsp. cloacae]